MAISNFTKLSRTTQIDLIYKVWYNHDDWHLKEQLKRTSVPLQMLGSSHLIKTRGASNRTEAAPPPPVDFSKKNCDSVIYEQLQPARLTAEGNEMPRTKWKEACLICLGACQIIRYDRNRWPCTMTWLAQGHPLVWLRPNQNKNI